MGGPAQRVFSDVELLKFAKAVFVALGADEDNADVVAKHLVDASLRGVDSHGVVRVLVYAQGIHEGEIDPRAKPGIVRESSSTALIDGHKGFGQVAASFATEVAAQKAKASGSSAVGVKNLNHVGMLAYYGRTLAEAGLIGMAYASGFPRATPWGGRGRVFGTNPLCYAFPCRGGEPIVIDIATTAVAAFKIMLADKAGKSIPGDWALDREGAPTTDPKKALEGSLLPMAGHKGYGLALSVDVLSRILVGGLPYTITRDVAYTQGGFFVEALEVEAFVSAEEYLRGVDELVGRIRKTPLARGHDKIYLPGEPENITRERRLKEGIPVEETLWQNLRQLAEKLSVSLPSAVR